MNNKFNTSFLVSSAPNVCKQVQVATELSLLHQ